KFGNDACAKRIAGVSNYTAILKRNLRLASTQGRLIVRHLLLPGHHECCYRPIVDWLAKNLPDVEFSLRDGYLPAWRAHRFEELARTVRRDEAHDALELASAARLKVIQ